MQGSAKYDPKSGHGEFGECSIQVAMRFLCHGRNTQDNTISSEYSASNGISTQQTHSARRIYQTDCNLEVVWLSVAIAYPALRLNERVSPKHKHVRGWYTSHLSDEAHDHVKPLSLLGQCQFKLQLFNKACSVPFDHRLAMSWLPSYLCVCYATGVSSRGKRSLRVSLMVSAIARSWPKDRLTWRTRATLILLTPAVARLVGIIWCILGLPIVALLLVDRVLRFVVYRLQGREVSTRPMPNH